MKLSEFFETHDWCQHHQAKNQYGEPTLPLSYFATQFCLAGACVKLTTKRYTHLLKILHLEAYKRGFPSIGDFNDQPDMTKEKIIQFLKEINQ